ncbi:hypothetical protein DH2020_044394 [Rehmannia glutinosa]|uniref:Uncharacterized protein n=1 Tax=Rehmannia glutinosa TaxID=99300 RepID=A0ABR0UH39_REHGL
METNTCNINHLDSDALLPPRKRLLAGLKRQNSDVNSPPPSTPSSAGSESDTLLNNPLRVHLSNPNLSNEEIVEASRIAAIEAAKVAKALRAKAEEKAAKAAKAVAAAKSALDLVATISEEAANKEKCLKKNKMKKHVTVEALYNNKNKGNTNCRTDEELARKLHRTINSSPRILKNTNGSDTKNHKRLKSSAFSKEGNQPSTTASNGNGLVREVETEGAIKKIDVITVDLNTSKPDKNDQRKLDNGEEWRPSKNERLKLGNNEILDSFGKKRGRIKQKKLPLSICSFRDQNGPKEDLKSQGMPLLEDNNVGTAVGSQPLFSSGNSLLPAERTSMWKCQSFKVPACVKQNKVMQS